MDEGMFHKRVSFSVSLPGLETMQPLFHENVVSAYVQLLLAAAGQISSSDVEYSRQGTAGGTRRDSAASAGGPTLVDFVVTFPPIGEDSWGLEDILCTVLVHHFGRGFSRWIDDCLLEP